MARKHFPAAPVVFAILMGACVSPSTTDSTFSAGARPPAGMGLVYIFRTDVAAAPLVTPVVLVNGKQVVALQREAYTALYLPAGWHKVGLEPEGYPPTPPAKDLEFNVAAGQVSALGLGFIRTRLNRPEMEVETKQGMMTVPSRAGTPVTYEPFVWRHVEGIEKSPLFDDLRQRHYRKPLAYAH